MNEAEETKAQKSWKLKDACSLWRDSQTDKNVYSKSSSPYCANRQGRWTFHILALCFVSFFGTPSLSCWCTSQARIMRIAPLAYVGGHHRAQWEVRSLWGAAQIKDVVQDLTAYHAEMMEASNRSSLSNVSRLVKTLRLRRL